MATDLGVYDDYIVDHLEDSDVLLIEANHDISMLEAGHYPYPLKRRILGEWGHLSNEELRTAVMQFDGGSFEICIFGTFIQREQLSGIGI